MVNPARLAVLDIATNRGVKWTTAREAEEFSCIAFTLGLTPVRLGETQPTECTTATDSRLKAAGGNPPAFNISCREVKEAVGTRHIPNANIRDGTKWSHQFMTSKEVIKVACPGWQELID